MMLGSFRYIVDAFIFLYEHACMGFPESSMPPALSFQVTKEHFPPRLGDAQKVLARSDFSLNKEEGGRSVLGMVDGFRKQRENYKMYYTRTPHTHTHPWEDQSMRVA